MAQVKVVLAAIIMDTLVVALKAMTGIPVAAAVAASAIIAEQAVAAL